MTKTSNKVSSALTRRDVFHAGTLAAASSFLGPAATAAARLPVRGKGTNVYEKLGVKPFINCTSTRTMNGGSAALPEVVEAVYEASFYHVNMQELLRKAGPRIAELLEVPAATVSSGAAGANGEPSLASWGVSRRICAAASARWAWRLPRCWGSRRCAWPSPGRSK